MPVDNVIDNVENIQEIVNNALEDNEISSDPGTTNIYYIDNRTDNGTDLDKNEISSDSDISSEMVLQSVSIQTKTVTPSDATGFKASLLSVIGNYETVTTDYTYSNTQGYTQHVVETEPDFCWIAAALYVLVGIYCTFRILGSLFDVK